MARRYVDYGDNYLNNNVSIKDRLIDISGEITEESAAQYMRALDIFSLESSKKPIKVFINTGGGDVYDALGLYDLLIECPFELITIARCKTMSAGMLLLLAGDSRHALNHVRFMDHPSSSCFEGSTNNNKIKVMEQQTLDNICYNIYAERTGKSVSFWKKLFNNGNYYFDKSWAYKNGILTSLSINEGD